MAEAKGVPDASKFQTPEAAMPLRLVMTCTACPEQYDVYDGPAQVGYIRLRHGSMTVECPDVNGVEVYSAAPNGDGCFDPDERDYFLRHAVHAIEKWQRGELPSRPPAPDVEYEVQ